MKLSKAVKNLDTETVSDLQSLSQEDLKKRIVEANQAMQEVSEELDNNQEYQNLVESKKAMEAGKKEVFKRQNSIITVAVSLLNSTAS